MRKTIGYITFVINLFIAVPVMSSDNRAATSISAPALASQNFMRPPQILDEPAIAEAVVSINEQFANAFIEALFTQLRAPSFPLTSATANTAPNELDPEAPWLAASLSDSVAVSSTKPEAVAPCANVVVLEREMSGVRTMVRFEAGRIVAPLAFSGSYSAGLLGCLRFSGWANALVTLEFDRNRQVLQARVNVSDIHLNDLSPRAANLVKGLLQTAINRRVNPVDLAPASQLTARLPVPQAGGALRLRVNDVRPEILPQQLRLHLACEFVRAE